MDIGGPGLRLARDYFAQSVQPILRRALPDLRYDAGLIGSGSEVLGYDTERSRDHDFGPRCIIFTADADRAGVAALLDRELPREFAGYATRFTRGVEPALVGKIATPHNDAADPESPPHGNGECPPSQVIVTTAIQWSIAALALDATRELSPIDWLGLPWQLLAETTSGAIFHTGLGDLPAFRTRLGWYPDDLWRHVIAAQWQRIAQEEPFVGRTGEVGDDLGSAIVTGRLVRDVMRLALLLHRRYPPYPKWTGTAFQQLPDAATLGPMLEGALRGRDGKEREKHLCQGYAFLGALHNDLAISEPVDPRCRQFYTRPFRVLDAQRFALATVAAMSDPAVRALPLIGCVDQISDSTDVLSNATRARTLTQALYR